MARRRRRKFTEEQKRGAFGWSILCATLAARNQGSGSLQALRNNFDVSHGLVSMHTSKLRFT